MDGGIITLFTTLVERGEITSVTLDILVACMLCYIYRYFLIPMKSKLDTTPSTIEMEKSFAGLHSKFSDTNNKFDLIEKGIQQNFSEIRDILDKLESFLDRIDDAEKASTKELNDIKRDIEHVKGILNQFQGHMMYGGQDRRASDFGNKELR